MRWRLGIQLQVFNFVTLLATPLSVKETAGDGEMALHF